MQGTVSEVMNRDVVTVTRATSFRDAVRIVEEHHVDGLPVVESNDRVVGIVTESDLLLKEELLAGAAVGIGLAPAVRRERAKAAATTVERLMSTPAITVRPETPLGEAAHVMHKRRIGRLPVVDDDGRLLGIVTRSDLLSVFLRDDDQLLDDVSAAIASAAIRDAAALTVDVRDGVVSLSGTLPRRSHALAVLEAVRRVPGLSGIEDRMRSEFDDVNVALVGP